MAANIGLVVCSVVVIYFVGPLASGSGIPEVKGYLNGVRVSYDVIIHHRPLSPFDEWIDSQLAEHTYANREDTFASSFVFLGFVSRSRRYSRSFSSSLSHIN